MLDVSGALIGTVRGNRVNIHLLLSPEDPNHVAELKRFLGRLTFKAFNDTFSCNQNDLVRLGQCADPKIQSIDAALRHGATQFKVAFEELQGAFNDHAWAKSNILVAVAAGSSDGTSGLRDASDATQRAEVEKFADVIFSSNPNDRDYWLGRRALQPDQIRDRYGALKPCLRGSDAHNALSVGAPEADRFTWIKGEPIFDSLRQACIVPEGRTYVGNTPPIGATPSQVISKVTVIAAPWVATPTIALNPGLVAVIGARGSGKTALADMIAAGCDAVPEVANRQSFLSRAREHLHGTSVRLDWQTAESAQRSLDEPEPFADVYPRARYLSQQFVEELCTSDGITDALLAEIERVIFEAHDSGARDGTIDFKELLDLRATRFRQNRNREEQALSSLSDRISAELQNERLVAGLTSQLADKSKAVARYIADREKLVAKGSEERVARLDALNRAAEKTRARVRRLNLQTQDLLAVQDEVADVRANQAPEQLREIRFRHAASELKDDEWSTFVLDFKGNVDEVLSAKLKRARKDNALWKGVPPPPMANGQIPFLAADDDLERQPLSLLEAEIARLEAQVNADRETRTRYASVSKRVVAVEKSLVALLR